VWLSKFLQTRKEKHMIIYLEKADVDRIFAEATHQDAYIDGLYKLAFESAGIDWDAVGMLDAWPRICRSGDHAIFKRAIAFDRRAHPHLQPGLAWTNRGFSSNAQLESTMDAWQVELPSYQTV